jgi:hypothetical protein
LRCPASRLPALLDEFFDTRTAGDVDSTMAYFTPDMAGYIDATLSWDFDSHAAVKAVLPTPVSPRPARGSSAA